MRRVAQELGTGAVAVLATADPERQFEFGLDVFIGGLVAQASQRS